MVRPIDAVVYGRTTVVDPGTMERLYYGINPPRHAERAAEAPGPDRGKVDGSGRIVALVTTIYNKPPFGALARCSVVTHDNAIHAFEVATPGKLEIEGLAPDTEVLIRPETVGTMVKLLTPEQIARTRDEA